MNDASGAANATSRQRVNVRSARGVLRPSLLLLGLASLVGCATAPATIDGADRSTPPGWLRTLPRESNVIYAVGIAGPTYFAEDSLRYAQDDARVQLSHALASKVTAITVSVTNDGNSGWTDSAGVVESITGDYTDAVVELSEIVGTWVDRQGGYSGRAGTSYALARLDLTRAPPVFTSPPANDATPARENAPGQAAVEETPAANALPQATAEAVVDSERATDSATHVDPPATAPRKLKPGLARPKAPHRTVDLHP